MLTNLFDINFSFLKVVLINCTKNLLEKLKKNAFKIHFRLKASKQNYN